MEDKVIEEVDEKYENDLTSGRKVQGLSSIYQDLSFATRDVNKIVSRMGYRHLDHNTKEKERAKSPIKVHKQMKKESTVISKYNYYGKKYRFEEREELLNIEPPVIQRPCLSEANFQAQKNGLESKIKTQQAINFSSVKPEVDQSIFFDDGKIQFPTKNYYIYFEDQDKGKKKQKKKKIEDRDFKEQTVPNKFKPAWLMEKKINNLQKEVKELKEKEKKMGMTMESVMMQTNSSMRKGRKSGDFPINIKSNIERMVDSLWK